MFETEWRCGYGCSLYQVCKRLILCLILISPNHFFSSALLLGREEEAVPRGSGNTHPEDLPWLEVPHSLSPVEEEPGGGGCLVPKICGEHQSLHLPQKSLIVSGIKRQNFFKSQNCWLFLIVATKEVPEHQVLCLSGSVIHQRMEGRFQVHCMSFPLANKGLSSLCNPLFIGPEASA